jgi:hypothetical protein
LQQVIGAQYFAGYTNLFERIGNTTVISIGYSRVIGEIVIVNLTL